jgi:hypothetical protein
MAAPQKLDALEIAPDLLVTAIQKHVTIPIHAPQGKIAQGTLGVSVQAHPAM